MSNNHNKLELLIAWAKANGAPELMTNIELYGRWRKPICARCNIDMEVKEVGINAIYMFMDPPQPYEIWNADLYQCPICTNEIVTGFGNKGTAHFQEDFDVYLKETLKRTHVYCYEKVRTALTYKHDDDENVMDIEELDPPIKLLQRIFSNSDKIIVIESGDSNEPSKNS